jgi:hypothetical protein
MKYTTDVSHSVFCTWVFLIIFNGIMALATLYINISVIWSVLESRRLRSSNYNLLLAVLSFVDLLIQGW